MQIWRICRARFAGEAFSGIGVRRFGGRWNSSGVPMVYASTSLGAGGYRAICPPGAESAAG